LTICFTPVSVQHALGIIYVTNENRHFRQSLGQFFNKKKRNFLLQFCGGLIRVSANGKPVEAGVKVSQILPTRSHTWQPVAIISGMLIWRILHAITECFF